jgi:integrase
MLSDRRIRSLRPAAKDQWVSDGNGLYLRVRATGARSWVLRRKRGGKAEVITLGAWPGLNLATARAKAGELTGKSVSNVTLGELLDGWHAEFVAPNYRRPKHVAGYIERLDAGLKATKLRHLERLELRAVVRRYADKRGEVAARRLWSLLKLALRFAVDCGHLDASPLDGASPDLVGAPEVTRDRVLSDEEIGALWHTSAPHTPLLKFLLLTGARIGEAQHARWSDVRGDRWHVPAAHMKNGKPHWVALSRQALALLRTRDESRELIFGTATDTGVQAWLRRWCEREGITPAFRPHDLRRTAATRMNALGVMPHVVERVLSHSLQGVMAVYNRADYETERTEAMQRWANDLDRIIAS